VDLDTLMVATYCLVDDALKAEVGVPLRGRGPAPALADAEVLTIEVVGEFLGLDQDKAIFRHFRRHYGEWFPALRRVRRVRRTTFARQAANLWVVKERLWRAFAARLPHDPEISLVDSFPLPVCRFARAHRCRLYAGQAAFGHDEVARQTYYGFRCHVRLAWPGGVIEVGLAPANVSDLAALPSLAAGAAGYLVGDRNSWSPELTGQLREAGLCLLAPDRWATRDPDPVRSRSLSRARDPWHLASRLLRKVLGHTAALLINAQAGNPPRQLARLLALNPHTGLLISPGPAVRAVSSMRARGESRA